MWMGALVFADAHLHSTPRGMGARRVAERFRRVGGWFMALVMLPPWHYVDGFKPSLDNYRRAQEVFLRECREAQAQGLRVACLAGFHPAEVDKLIGMGLKPEEVLRLAEEVIGLVEGLCARGEISGVGEIGRQHYKTTPERFAIAEAVMIRGLEVAKDHSCIVHLHLENAGPITVDTTLKIVDYVGVKRNRIFFHHASLRVAERAIEVGATATIPGKKELLRRAFTSLNPLFMVESDYIDDPKRPCVSSCPWEVVEAQKQLLEEGVVDEEVLARVNIDNIVRFYGVEPP